MLVNVCPVSLLSNTPVTLLCIALILLTAVIQLHRLVLKGIGYNSASGAEIDILLNC